jgi:hypothetical protein
MLDPYYRVDEEAYGLSRFRDEGVIAVKMVKCGFEV